MRHQHDPAVSVYKFRALFCKQAMSDPFKFWYTWDDPCGCLDAIDDLPAGSTVRIEDAGFGSFASPLKVWR